MAPLHRLTGIAFLACAAAAAWACARMEPPPGGPPDVAPPRLVATRPDSLARLPDFKGAVEFRFDEVISEGSSPNQGTGTGDLEKLIVLSPTTRVPDVSWRRERISVRPAEGWRPNRVYRVELLPGVTDLRRNRSPEGRVVTFTTGAPLPTVMLDGTVVDWSTSRPAAGALVEALLEPDSLPYRALADSSGKFSFGPLPAGDYLVRGVIDQNHNLRFDPREPFDSVRLTRGKTGAGELWAFVHDTAAPRIRTVTIDDSTTAMVELTQSLDPSQRLTKSQMTVRILPDSTPVPFASLLPKPLDDSLHRPAGEKADTSAGRRPGAAPAPPAVPKPLPKPPAAPPAAPQQGALPRGARPRTQPAAQPLTTRPPLSAQLVLRMPRPWKPESRYEIEVRGLRNVTGTTGDVRAAFAIPKPAAADTLRGKKDSLTRKPPPGRAGAVDTAAPKPPAKRP